MGDEFFNKLRKYLLLFEQSFNYGVALSGHEENLPLIKVGLAKVPKSDSFALMVALKLGDTTRRGVVLIETIQDRLRLEAMPFDPQRLTEIIEGERGKEFLLTIMSLSLELFDADYGVKKVDDKYVLIVHNDMLKDFITYDELEEELYGVLSGVMNLYNKLVELGFKPKLRHRHVDAEGYVRSDKKGDDELVMFARAFSRRSSPYARPLPAP